jgi:SAM-dependent methyltransferase
MIDFIYKLARKSLNQRIYRKIQLSSIGRAAAWEQIETYTSQYKLFKSKLGRDYKKKIIFELGPGNQLFTAIHYLTEGASKVILSDPKLVLSHDLITTSIEKFNNSYSNKYITYETVKDRVQAYSDINEIPVELYSKIDFIFSNLVLEHLNDLPKFFTATARLLSNTGLSFNTVDLSDHTYHIFTKYKYTKFIAEKRALSHLKYSNNIFKKINDDKCYMNRLLLPVYLELAEINNLNVELFHTSKHRKVKIHNDVLQKCKNKDTSNLYITYFELILTKNKN